MLVILPYFASAAQKPRTGEQHSLKYPIQQDIVPYLQLVQPSRSPDHYTTQRDQYGGHDPPKRITGGKAGGGYDGGSAEEAPAATTEGGFPVLRAVLRYGERGAPAAAMVGG